MRFQCVDTVNVPVEDVFQFLRDDMERIVPYLPDVDEIRVLERTDQEDGRIRIINRWTGSSGKAPKALRKFLKADWLSWKDHALWESPDPRRATWRLEPSIGGSLFECDGTTTIIPGEGETCQVEVQGDLRIYPERFPGVPRLLAGRLKGSIESFIVGLVVPNMQVMARGVQAYFDDLAGS